MRDIRQMFYLQQHCYNNKLTPEVERALRCVSFSNMNPEVALCPNRSFVLATAPASSMAAQLRAKHPFHIDA
jgi:hypothetical protein